MILAAFLISPSSVKIGGIYIHLGVLFVETSSLDHIHFVPPTGAFTTFENEEAYIAKGVEWKLFTERTVKKELMYKTNGVQVKVKPVGYQEYGNDMQTIVIEFEDGQLSCIHPAYLKEMQSASFGKESFTGEPVVISPATLNEKEQSAAETVIVKKSNKTRVKKEPVQPKLALPEEKVHFTATVKEFTTKANHFTGEEDEVILLELVKVEGEQEIEVGDAWCSFSKTLKKTELEVGDELEFDGKIIEKKFNKDIRYKINNPSKLTKVKM